MCVQRVGLLKVRDRESVGRPKAEVGALFDKVTDFLICGVKDSEMESPEEIAGISTADHVVWNQVGPEISAVTAGDWNEPKVSPQERK